MAFATVEDVATRLARALSATDAGTAEQLLDAAAAVIADAASKDDAWVAQLSPVPSMLRFLSVELVVRAMSNPEGLASFREQIGVHQFAKNFRAGADGGGLMLTPVEELLVRRTVYGRTSGSPTVASVTDDLPLIDPFGPLDCFGS